MSENVFPSLVGRVFGKLTVVELLPERTKYRARIYRCRCECGNMRDVVSQELTAGNVKSCTACATGRGRPRIHPPQITQKDDLTKRGRPRIHPPQERQKRDNASLNGKRFGRLTVLHPLERRFGTSIALLCRCDCGNVTVAKKNNLVQGNTRSCGCLTAGRGPSKARCPSCGEAFPVAINGEPTPQFCPSCAPKYAGRNWNVCPVCGKLFATPPSNRKVTCSKECSSAWRARMLTGVPHKWGKEAKARLSKKGQTENLKLGTDAAKVSPIAGRFETNQEALVWVLIDPTGQEYTVRNLKLWARENAELFGKEPGDKSGEQISAGFRQIAATMRGKRKTPATSYFGWTLKCLPREPNEND